MCKRSLLFLAFVVGVSPFGLRAQSAAPAKPESEFQGRTTREYNQRIEQLRQLLAEGEPGLREADYRIGPEDLLAITVFEAPELNRSVRVAASGEFSLPLLGSVRAAGLTPRELETVLQELLRRSYIKDPHVSVFVAEMQSHPVAVFGAVKKPGVFQIRGAKPLLEVLALAEGLAEDAGDTVLVMRGVSATDAPGSKSTERGGRAGGEPGAGQADRATANSSATDGPTGGETIEISLKSLLESGDTRSNVLVYPGDIVKVTRAGIVYVVGEVKKPGGFMLKSNENISVLQAIALAEGLTRTSAKSQARIIRTDQASGARSEIPINLDKILGGKAGDLLLQPRDIVFVPNSTGRSALYRGAEAALSIVGGVIVYRR